MPPSCSSGSLLSLSQAVAELVERLPALKHGPWIQQALVTLVRLASQDPDRLDWKILTSSQQDMERGFRVFRPYRHIRKVALFGSSRLPQDSPEYRMASAFARCMTQQGFMTITGAGRGIMQAGNEGAGAENSFGLNVQLPFEYVTNPFIEDCRRIDFKYFFTRKLFFLRESDAIALFPGGFGTQDEAFECLTLSQTGKFGPAPLILIDRPGGDYWQAWNQYIQTYLLEPGLIGAEDTRLYTITDCIEVACKAITDFYRVYHSSRYVGKQLIIRLNHALSEAEIEQLNARFRDILVQGNIENSDALPQEAGDETASLPRLALHFNRRDFGRLYQLIADINQLGANAKTADEKTIEHPERK